LHSEYLHDVSYSAGIIQVIEIEEDRMVVCGMHTEFWRGNLKRPVVIDVRRILKWILKETGWDSVGWM